MWYFGRDFHTSHFSLEAISASLPANSTPFICFGATGFSNQEGANKGARNRFDIIYSSCSSAFTASSSRTRGRWTHRLHPLPPSLPVLKWFAINRASMSTIRNSSRTPLVVVEPGQKAIEGFERLVQTDTCMPSIGRLHWHSQWHTSTHGTRAHGVPPSMATPRLC